VKAGIEFKATCSILSSNCIRKKFKAAFQSLIGIVDVVDILQRIKPWEYVNG
jgi:hypothetical protein